MKICIRTKQVTYKYKYTQNKQYKYTYNIITHTPINIHTYKPSLKYGYTQISNTYIKTNT